MGVSQVEEARVLRDHGGREGEKEEDIMRESCAEGILCTEDGEQQKES